MTTVQRLRRNSCLGLLLMSLYLSPCATTLPPHLISPQTLRPTRLLPRQTYLCCSTKCTAAAAQSLRRHQTQRSGAVALQPVWAGAVRVAPPAGLSHRCGTVPEGAHQAPTATASVARASCQRTVAASGASRRPRHRRHRRCTATTCGQAAPAAFTERSAVGC